MSGLEKALFNLKFTAKQLNVSPPLPPNKPHPPPPPPPAPQASLAKLTPSQRQSAKAGKDEQTEKTKLKKAIQQNHSDIAKIYAQNAIRKQNEKLSLLRLASRIDAVSSRVQTAVTMRQVTGSMANVVKGMDGAMKSMDLEKVSSGRRWGWTLHKLSGLSGPGPVCLCMCEKEIEG